MKILVIGSCTNKKKFTHNFEPNCNDIRSINDLKKFINKYPEKSCKAKDMYIGNQHISLLNAIKILKNICQIDYLILSAGYGLLDSEELISSYNCSFAGMTPEQIMERSRLLNIEIDYQKNISKNYNLVYLALGLDYSLSLGAWDKYITCPTIAFQKSKNQNVLSLKANNEVVSKYSKLGYKINGVNGFKGDFLLIIAKIIQKNVDPCANLDKISSSVTELQNFISNKVGKPKNRTILDFYK